MANFSVAKIETTRAQNGPLGKKDGPRYSDKTSIRWDAYPETLAAICLLCLHAGTWGTDDEFRVKRSATDLGYTKELMTQMLRNTVPGIFQIYLEKTGKELSAQVIYDRFHKMYYGASKPGETTKGGDDHCQLSKEHPKQHPLRRKALAIVEARIRKVGWYAPNMGDWDYAELANLITEDKAAKKRKKAEKAKAEAKAKKRDSENGGFN